MPSTYAHFRIGQQARKVASQNIKDIINKYPQLYLIGVHGSDILFFYRPLFSSRVSKLGHKIHRNPGLVFFASARTVIDTCKNQNEREQCLAYLYGVLAHFAMDITCHGIVFDAQNNLGLAHTEIESEFDRRLLEHDGKIGYLQPLTNHLIASKKNARIICKFYPELTAWQVQESVRSMIFYHKLFLAPNGKKRKIIFAAMRLFGIYHNMHGLVMNYSENPIYKNTTEELMKQYPIARKCVDRLFLEYEKYLKHEDELGDDFLYDFEARYHG